MKKFCLLTLLLGFFLVTGASARERNVNIYDEGRPVPETPVYDRSGQAVYLTDFKDNFVMAVFWSKNCRPCIRELDDLNGFYNKTKNNGIVLLLISPEEDWETAFEQQQFLKRFGAPDLPFYVDKKGKLAGDFGIFTSPHTVLIDTNSQEIGRIHGGADWDSDAVIEYMYRIKADSSRPKETMNLDKGNER